MNVITLWIKFIRVSTWDKWCINIQMFSIVGYPRVNLIDSLFHHGEKACELKHMVCDDGCAVDDRTFQEMC